MSDDDRAWHVHATYQLVAHSVYSLAHSTLSDHRRRQIFTLEWMYMVTKENVTGIVSTTICLVLYCQLQSIQQLHLIALHVRHLCPCLQNIQSIL